MSAEYAMVLPELIMAGSAMALLMLGAYGGGDRQQGLITGAAAGLMLALAVWIGTTTPSGQTAFSGAFVDDRFGQFAKVAVLFASAIMLVLGQAYLERRKLMRFEYPVLILLATLGMMMMVSSGDLIALYVGLELQSLALYVIAAFNRDSVRSTEAGLKYFVLGALSSGLLLYGASLVYGYTGSTNFTLISGVIKSEGVSLGLTFGLVFICAALAFKISAAPFHMWTPDVYEGSPTPVTAFFATAPKVAAGALFARVLYGGFGDAVHDWQQILVFVAIASMFLGAIAAIGQKNLKRLMAYSSIGHMGFALVGLAAGTETGAQSLMFYLAIYVVMNVGVFAFILSMEREGKPVVQISDLAGLSRDKPAHALGVAILMFSLAGLPPLVGFFAKFFVFKAAVEAGLAPLALAGAIASVIGAYYYLNIVRVMYLSEPDQPLELVGGVFAKTVMGIAAFAMVAGWLPFVSSSVGLDEAAMGAAAALVR